jgi:polyphosphate kinase
MIRRGLMAAGVWAGLSGAVCAHPHVFIDAAIEVIFDDQARATALRITWAYDDLFSLLIVEDRGMDADFDGVLTPEETVAIQGFDMNWEAGFAGDTYALQGDLPLALSGPSDWQTGYADGRLTSVHLRRFASPVPVAGTPLVVQVYDPSFYTAYSIESATLTGAAPGCKPQTFAPDAAAADQILQDAIAELAGSSDVEGAFPAIGAAYAEEVRVTCAAPS